MVDGWGVRPKDQTGVLVVGVSPSHAQPRVPMHVFGVEVASRHDWQSPAETGGHVRSDQWAGRDKYRRHAG